MNLIFLQWHDKSLNFWTKLVKIWHKIIQKHWHLQHWLHNNRKIDDYESIYNVNVLYLRVNHANGYVKKKMKIIIFDSTDYIKELLRKYADVWNRIKNKIKAINIGDCNYGNDYMKIKFNSDDDLTLNKPLKFHKMTIIIKFVFEENGKLYLQVF